MIVIVAFCIVFLAVAASFAVATFRRDDHFFGLVSLVAILVAAIFAIVYAGVDSA